MEKIKFLEDIKKALSELEAAHKKLKELWTSEPEGSISMSFTFPAIQRSSQ